MKKHNVVALVGTLALLANLLVPGLAFGASDTTAGTAQITCGGAVDFGSILPDDAFGFGPAGTAAAMTASSGPLYAYNNPDGSLNVATGEDFVSVSDTRDPSDACNTGLNLTLTVLNPGTAVESRFFDSADGVVAGFSIPLNTTYLVTSADTCPVGWTQTTGSDVCIEDAARCGAGLNNASVLCSTGDFGVTNSTNYDGTDFVPAAIGDVYTAALGTGADTTTPRTVLSFPNNTELYGVAGLGFSYGVAIPAGQPSGTYVLELEYAVAAI